MADTKYKHNSMKMGLCPFNFIFDLHSGCGIINNKDITTVTPTPSKKEEEENDDDDDDLQ